jgi:hypothetical protein
MTEINLWFEKPGSPSVKLRVGDNIPISQLRNELIDLSYLPDRGLDDRSISYEVVCLRTGTILRGDTSPISYLVRDGDHLFLQISSSNSSLYIEGKVIKSQLDALADSLPLKQIIPGDVKPLDDFFSVTGIQPCPQDFSTEHPVFAVYIRSSQAGNTGRINIRAKIDNLITGRIPIYTKNTFFLIADTNNEFRWVSAAESSYFIPELSMLDPVYTNRQSTRYSIGKEGKEPENMIIPVRPFSITGITLEGFDPGKEYPVLAIDTDQYMMNENPEPGETETRDQQPASQLLAFFLVGSDIGEFAWIAEDECRLFPLK